MTRFEVRIRWMAAIMWLAGCAEASPGVEATVAEYYAVYAERSDAARFMEFYADTVELRDYVAGERVQGVDALREFFDWGDSRFQMGDTVALYVTSILADADRAVVQGHFTPFDWGDVAVGAMHFTTILTFDADRRIALQEDWINYPAALLDYGSRGDSNAWIGREMRGAAVGASEGGPARPPGG